MSDPVVQQIKERLDIAEVMSEYLQLRRAGVNFKALCPFHQEKTPSLMINRERGIWRCFGCNEGGDVFSFVQKHEGLSFPEVLKILADKAGVKLPERTAWQNDDREAELRHDLLKINELAAKFYHESLLRSQSGEIARKYLQSRGLTAETIKKWQLGFAPDDWHSLSAFLTKRGYSEDKIIGAGLAIKSSQIPNSKFQTRNSIYDRFRFRVMFPLHDYHGRVVGFTARALAEQETSKYINSPETAIYHKSKFLFGYYFAKNAIRQDGEAVIVEGNMDAISSHQAGLENVVASSGTALTPEQLNIISRLTKNLVFAFDTDKAGLNATRRGLETALALGFKVKIAEITEGKDPDELIRQDKDAWPRVIRSAPNFLDFSFNLIFGKIKTDNKEQLRQGAQEFLEVVALVDDPITQAQEARRVSEKLDVPVQSVLEQLKKMRPGRTLPKTAVAAKFHAPAKPRRELLEERILGIALVEADLRSTLASELSVSDFSTLVEAAEFVIKNKAKSGAPDNLSFLQFIGEEELSRLKDNYPDSSKVKNVFIDLCRALKGVSLREQMESLSKQIAEQENTGQAGNLSDLRNKFSELSLQLSRVSKD